MNFFYQPKKEKRKIGISETMLLPIASSVWFLAWCGNVRLSVYLKILVSIFTNLILFPPLSSCDFQKFVDFVASSFVSTQNDIGHGNQLKGPSPLPSLIYNTSCSMNWNPVCMSIFFFFFFWDIDQLQGLYIFIGFAYVLFSFQLKKPSIVLHMHIKCTFWCSYIVGFPNNLQPLIRMSRFVCGIYIYLKW